MDYVIGIAILIFWFGFGYFLCNYLQRHRGQFIRDFMRETTHGDDVYGEDLQALLIKYRFCEMRPMTEEECGSEWAQEYQMEPGDEGCMYTKAGKKILELK